MEQERLVTEAQALADRLFRAWDATEHHTVYAARLVAVAERAHNRYLRRLAQCGDPLAQRWLMLLERAVSE